MFINGANIIQYDSDSRYPNRPRNLPSARGRDENESGLDAGHSSRRALPSRRGRSAYATRTRTLSTHLHSRVQQSGPRSGGGQSTGGGRVPDIGAGLPWHHDAGSESRISRRSARSIRGTAPAHAPGEDLSL